MLRLAELALFLVPFAMFAIWRIMATEGGPSLRLVAVAACVLAVLATLLVWLSREQAMPPGSTYEPARLQDGRVVSGHPAPP